MDHVRFNAHSPHTGIFSIVLLLMRAGDCASHKIKLCLVSSLTSLPFRNWVTIYFRAHFIAREFVVTLKLENGSDFMYSRGFHMYM